jgi:hypothetical protein
MRRVSKKRAVALRVYTKLRREFLEERNTCEFPLGCTERATTIQHLRGRRGWRLLKVEWWAASCWAHNSWAEDHTGEALAIGWLLRIESVDGAA